MRHLLLLSCALACALAFTACKASPASELKGAVEEAVEGERQGNVLAVHGKTEPEVLESLGKPNKSKDFAMKDCCHEFEIELWNTYRPDNPAHADVPIRERHWNFDEHILTVWFHQVDGEWVALDTHLWHESMKF